MRVNQLLSAVLFALLCFDGYAEVGSNIVIPEMKETVTLVAARNKDNLFSITSVKKRKEFSYRATRVPETAVAVTWYDKVITIDKAKSKGVTPIYTSAPSKGIFYDDHRVCMLKVPVSVGKNSDVLFESTVTRPDFCGWHYIGAEYPIHKYTLTIHIPFGFHDKISLKEYNVPDKVKISKEFSADGKEYVITVTADSLPALKDEDDAPPSRYTLPYVRLTGFFSDVNEYYTYFRNFTLEPDPEAEVVADFAKELTKDCSSDMEKIYAIQEWVRENIRYVAFEYGDLGFAPDTPSAVFKKKFGDCKGSAALIKAMLVASGVDGRLVWIGTDKIPDDFTDVPSVSTSNHMIAAAVVNDSIIYIDGTVGLAPRNYYSSSIQGKQTVVENGETPIIGRVPVLPVEATTDSTSLHFTLRGNSLSGIGENHLTGGYKSRINNLLNMSDKRKHNEILRSYLLDGRKKCTVDSLVVTENVHDVSPTVISGRINIDNVAIKSGNKMYLDPCVYPDFADFKCDLKDRNLPLWHKERRHIVRTVKIATDYPAEKVSLPDPLKVDNKYFTAELEYAVNDDGILCRFRYLNKEKIVPLEDLKAYNEDIAKMSKALSKRLIFNID